MITKKGFEIGDLFIRQMNFSETGDKIPEHTHKRGHTTVINFGRFLIKTAINGRVIEEVCGPGSSIHIPHDAPHALTCIEPGQAMCIFTKNYGEDAYV